MTEEEIKESVNGFIELTCKHTLNFFRLMGFETHIEATIIDESTGETFEFTFRKKESYNHEKEKTKKTDS